MDTAVLKEPFLARSERDVTIEEGSEWWDVCIQHTVAGFADGSRGQKAKECSGLWTPGKDLSLQPAK